MFVGTLNETKRIICVFFLYCYLLLAPLGRNTTRGGGTALTISWIFVLVENNITIVS